MMKASRIFFGKATSAAAMASIPVVRLATAPHPRSHDAVPPKPIVGTPAPPSLSKTKDRAPVGAPRVLKSGLPSIAFLGYGIMAKAMVAGMQSSPEPLFGRYLLRDIDAVAVRGAEMAISEAPVEVFEAPEAAVERANVIVLAVKPQGLGDLLQTLPVTKDHLIISIVAGWSIEKILAHLPKKSGESPPRVIRTMPNTPLQIGKGCTLFAACSRATEADRRLCNSMFSSCGMCAELKESQLDAVTGVSGSGPAFVALFLEALADGAVKMGIPRDLALQLAAKTIEGSAAMCTEAGGGLHPAVLKDRVCSAGGTSIHGISTLEEHGMRHAVISAVQAAATRSKQLNEQK